MEWQESSEGQANLYEYKSGSKIERMSPSSVWKLKRYVRYATVTYRRQCINKNSQSRLRLYILL